MLDQITNVYSLSVNVIALVVSLLYYINKPRRAWVYMIVFLLGNLLSNYYWTAYVLLMNDSPNVSSIMAYFGWDISYVALVLLLLHLRNDGEKRFFHPLSLLPIPVNLAQFFLYIQYGGLFNNIWQGVLCTAIACLSINSLMYYRRHRNSNIEKPYVAWMLLLYIFTEYTMWTASCFDWPGEWLNPYYYASVLCFALYFGCIWAIRKLYRDGTAQESQSAFERPRTILPPVYVAVTLLCCVGGYMLAAWIRGVLAGSITAVGETDPYSIIAVVLFVVSLVLVLFSVAVIMLVSFGQKAAESDALRQAKAIAEHSSAAKSDFLANMSHEIRTPINAVLGMNEMILREGQQSRDLLAGEGEAVREAFGSILNYAGSIESAGNNLLSIINDILDFSKIEAGKLDIVEAKYKLSSVLNDVSNMIVFKAREKGLDFHVDVDADLPDGLFGDEVRVRQIITNVLNNAVKYTKEGSVRMTVRREDDGHVQAGDVIRLIIAVKDTGIGIRPEDIGKLFQKFERVDLQTNSTVEGTGLGLAITQRLLEKMGGSIDVRSVYGEGSEFTIVLPQKVTSAEAVGGFKEQFRKSVQRTTVYRESFHAPDARILIVDDTRMNLTVAVSLLKETQINIDTAISGTEALALCETIRYDLILMDQRMPEMDGTVAMHLIRARTGSVNRDTPFICLTADAVSGARERYMAEGFTDYLTKPIDSFALERMLIKYLPADRIMIVPKPAPVSEGSDGGAPEGAFSALADAGIDVKAGLLYSQGDGDLYTEMLLEYLRGAGEKQRDIQVFYEARDWKNYSVHVHALKSTSGLIGASALSDMAAKLEAAADAGETGDISDNHETMMKLYTAVIGAIRRQVGSDAQLSRGGDASEDEILEFMPE